jgi:hyperosmotically inducible periplasmic protein
MRFLSVLFFAAVLSAGCSKDRSEDNRVSQNAVEPDNSARNAGDQNAQNKTAGDQSESAADRTISQNIRAAITGDDALSTDGKNVKIITSDGTVTLRGPVKSVEEKSEIEAKAKQITGVKKVDNQLEIAS